MLPMLIAMVNEKYFGHVMTDSPKSHGFFILFKIIAWYWLAVRHNVDVAIGK